MLEARDDLTGRDRTGIVITAIVVRLAARRVSGAISAIILCPPDRVVAHVEQTRVFGLTVSVDVATELVVTVRDDARVVLTGFRRTEIAIVTVLGLFATPFDRLPIAHAIHTASRRRADGVGIRPAVVDCLALHALVIQAVVARIALLVGITTIGL